MRAVEIAPTFEAWQAAARGLLRDGVPPDQVTWSDTSAPQRALGPVAAPPAAGGPVARVPRAFVDLAREVACHRDEARWRLLYAVLWRLVHGERALLAVEVDPEVAALLRMRQQVRHDTHKMTAFVRFRRVEHEDGERYVAWHRPDHRVLPLAAPFFAERFASMRWSILTPDAAAHWDGERLHYGPGAPRTEAPAEDELEALWREYYAAVFNPARLNLAAMRREMPARHWPTLPETAAIPRLLREAPGRVAAMVEPPARGARPWVPAGGALEALRAAAPRCQGCDLYRHASQVVFGAGAASARVVLVGEQPGDVEDRRGMPFVGPAGEVLDRALADAGLPREQLYVTNAVKHFKFIERGPRRIHQTPRQSEVTACLPWLEAELDAIKPAVVVCLGATAARALLGGEFRLLRQRGQVFATRWGRTLATLHPSAVLRGADAADQARLYAMLLEDLRTVAALAFAA